MWACPCTLAVHELPSNYPWTSSKVDEWRLTAGTNEMSTANPPTWDKEGGEGDHNKSISLHWSTQPSRGFINKHRASGLENLSSGESHLNTCVSTLAESSGKHVPVGITECCVLYCSMCITLLHILCCLCLQFKFASGGHVVECRIVNQRDGGSIPPAAISKLRQFHSPHICMCLTEETLKAGGPFYLVSMPGEVKDPTQGVNV